MIYGHCFGVNSLCCDVNGHCFDVNCYCCDESGTCCDVNGHKLGDLGQLGVVLQGVHQGRIFFTYVL